VPAAPRVSGHAGAFSAGAGRHVPRSVALPPGRRRCWRSMLTTIRRLQRRWLDLIAATRSGEVDSHNVAYLTDRVLLAKSERQVSARRWCWLTASTSPGICGIRRMSTSVAPGLGWGHRPSTWSSSASDPGHRPRSAIVRQPGRGPQSRLVVSRRAPYQRRSLRVEQQRNQVDHFGSQVNANSGHVADLFGRSQVGREPRAPAAVDRCGTRGGQVVDGCAGGGDAGGEYCVGGERADRIASMISAASRRLLLSSAEDRVDAVASSRVSRRSARAETSGIGPS
jgi:hypothetical protein